MVGRGGNNLFIPGREKRQEPRGGAPVGGGGLLTPGGGQGERSGDQRVCEGEWNKVGKGMEGAARGKNRSHYVLHIVICAGHARLSAACRYSTSQALPCPPDRSVHS